MAITTLSGANAGIRPPIYFSKTMATVNSTAGGTVSLWTGTGYPAAGTNQTGLAGSVLSSSSALVTGQIPHYNPSTGNAYLARFQAQSSLTGTLYLCDRLWSNTISGATGNQTINSPAWPARDNNGTINGEGVLIGMEFLTTGTGAAPAPTLTYTNTAGASGKTAGSINLDNSNSTNPIGTFVRIGLATGDIGVKSIQTITTGASITVTTLQLVAYRVLATLDIRQPGITYAVDSLTSGFQRIYDGTVPFLLFSTPQTVGTTYTIAGAYIETQG